MPATEPRPFITAVPSPAAESPAGERAPHDAPTAAAADPRPFVFAAEDPRPFVAASERDPITGDRKVALALGIDDSLWEMRVGDLIEGAPVMTVVAAGCAGILAGLAVRALIAR